MNSTHTATAARIEFTFDEMYEPEFASGCDPRTWVDYDEDECDSFR